MRRLKLFALALSCALALSAPRPALGTIAVAQVVQTIGVSGSGTVSQAITVSSGSTIVAIGAGLLGTTATLTFTDDGSGTWNDLTTTTQGGNSIRKGSYSVNRSGTITVTGTFGSANWIDRGLALVEITGGATASILDQFTGQAQSGVSGTDSATSGNTSTTTNATDLVLGWTICYNDSKSASTGTGYTAASGSPWAWDGNNLSIESKRVTSTGAYAATFTPPSSSSYTTHVAIFKEAAAGGGARDGQGFFGQPGLAAGAANDNARPLIVLAGDVLLPPRPRALRASRRVWRVTAVDIQAVGQ